MAVVKIAAKTVKNCQCSGDPLCNDAMHEDQERMENDYSLLMKARIVTCIRSNEMTAMFVGEA